MKNRIVSLRVLVFLAMMIIMMAIPVQAAAKVNVKFYTKIQGKTYSYVVPVTQGGTMTSQQLNAVNGKLLTWKNMLANTKKNTWEQKEITMAYNACVSSTYKDWRTKKYSANTTIQIQYKRTKAFIVWFWQDNSKSNAPLHVIPGRWLAVSKGSAFPTPPSNAEIENVVPNYQLLQWKDGDLYFGKKISEPRCFRMVALMAPRLSYYTVSYYANGGSGTMTPSANLAYGKTYNLKACKFTRTGYEFDYWKGTDNKTYRDHHAVKDLGNIGLYAMWKPVKINVEYNYDGGTVASPNPASYYGDQQVRKYLNVPTKYGYSFCWWTVNGKTNVNANEMTIPYYDKTGTFRGNTLKVKACFTPNQYTVVFRHRAADGNIVSKAKAVKYGESITLNQLPSGYVKWKLNGRSATYAGGVSIQVAKLVKAWDALDGSSKTLYLDAQVKPQQGSAYTVLFYRQDENGKWSACKRSVGENDNLVVPSGLPSGCTKWQMNIPNGMSVVPGQSIPAKTVIQAWKAAGKTNDVQFLAKP